MVLFIPLGVYAFNQQLATALYLASQSEFRSHFLLISEGDHQFIDQLSAASICYSTLDPVLKSGERAAISAGNNKQKRLMDTVPGFFKGIRWWQQLRHRKRVEKELVRRLAPCCTIVSEERPFFFLAVLKALKELSVPVILMPAADTSPDGTAWSRRESESTDSGLKNATALPSSAPGSSGIPILNRQVQRWLPSQVYNSPWGEMLFYPAQ